MTRVATAHTADLDPASLAAARDLLYEVFADEMTEEDWDHCLGGMHALVWEDEELVAHGAVVRRQLIHDGSTLRTGYVEGLAVRGDRRRRGLGGAVLTELERVVRAGYELGALGATEEAAPLYEAHGWQCWRGPTSALTPDGVVRTEEEDGWIYVYPVDARLDLDGGLTCDWRPGDLW